LSSSRSNAYSIASVARAPVERIEHGDAIEASDDGPRQL